MLGVVRMAQAFKVFLDRDAQTFGLENHKKNNVHAHNILDPKDTLRGKSAPAKDNGTAPGIAVLVQVQMPFVAKHAHYSHTNVASQPISSTIKDKS